MNVLVVAAHPDDEVLGCGGTMARLTAEGHHVVVGILGEGMTSRFDHRDDADPESLVALHARAQEANAVLGVERVLFGGLPDNRFDSVALLEVVKIIERWIVDVAPTRVYTQHGGDLNIDHRITYRATMTATRPTGSGCSVRELLAYEVASSTEWAFQKFEPVFRPNVFVDMAATFERKAKAMQAYESEIRAFPHPRSIENLRASATRWGAAAGMAMAEAFDLVRRLEP